ncbi:MAG: alpha/beta hydrolase [Croceibacterium sp.]
MMDHVSPPFRAHAYRSACGRLELFARDYGGDGPPLLLMHGLTRNSADFEPLVPHLVDAYRLVVPDQRGRGLSPNDPDPANYRPDIYAQDMFALLDSLGIEQVGLVGTSMGGLMAMIMAALQPDRIGAVVLNDVGPVLDPVGLARIGGYVGAAGPFASWQDAADRTAAINGTAFPNFGDSDWLAFARRTCREVEGGRVAFAYDPAIAAAFDSVPAEQPDLWPLWAMLADKPVLVLRGALSDLLAPDTVARMAKEHSGPFVACDIPQRGHAPLLDEPEALAAITSFLKRHRA